MRTRTEPQRWNGSQTVCVRSLLDEPGFDRDAYEDRLDWELRKIATDSRAIDLEIRSCAADNIYFLSRHFKHEDINSPGTIRRLIPNQIQIEIGALMGSGDWDEYVGLKPRKAGLSTWFDANIYWEARFRPNLRAAVIAHDRESTSQLFERLRFAHENLPEWLRPKLIRSSVKEIRFGEHNSIIRALTAGNTNVGRGSDLDRVHFSEAAFYPNLKKILLSIGEAVRPGHQIYWESTANGFNAFRDLYKAARAGGIRPGEPRRRAIFYRWYDDRKNRLALRTHEAEDLQRRLTNEERTLVSLAGLDMNQIAWRRVKKETLGEAFDQEHPEDDETCFLRTGTSKFNVPYWRKMQLIVEKRVRSVPFEILVRRFPDSAVLEDGNLTIWEPPMPGESYVIGADVAEGLPRGDFSAAGILKITSGGRQSLARREEVGEWLGKVSPGDFGWTLARLGWFYNGARLAIERNNHGHATIRVARVEAGYSPMYRHKELDQRGRNVGRLGFPTHPGTRRDMLDSFQRACMSGEHVVRSSRLCGQCMTFQAGQEDRKVDEEREGEDDTPETHDDLVFAWGIGDWVALKGAFAVA